MSLQAKKWPLLYHCLVHLFVLLLHFFTLRANLHKVFTTSFHWYDTSVHLIPLPILFTPSYILYYGRRSVNRVVWKSVKVVYTPWVMNPFKKCVRVCTYSALLVDLGWHISGTTGPTEIVHLSKFAVFIRKTVRKLSKTRPKNKIAISVGFGNLDYWLTD